MPARLLRGVIWLGVLSLLPGPLYVANGQVPLPSAGNRSAASESPESQVRHSLPSQNTPSYETVFVEANEDLAMYQTEGGASDLDEAVEASTRGLEYQTPSLRRGRFFSRALRSSDRSPLTLHEMFAKTKSDATHSMPQLRGGGRDWSQLVTEIHGVPQVRKPPAGANAFLLDPYNEESLKPTLQLRRSVVRAEEQDVTLKGEYMPVRRRRFLRRLGPQQLTQEQQEEAKRISKIAAKMGTDPTAIIGRVQTSYQHFAFSGGPRADNLVGSIVIPYHGEFVLRADVPYLWTDPNRPRAPKQNGISDLLVRTGGRVYTIPGYAFFAGADITFPTADKPQLGLGKYTVGPLFLTARVLPELKSLLFGTIQHQISVGGDPSRQNISITRFGLTVNTIWGERWWTQVEALTQLNWERKAKSSMTLEFEGGYRLTQDWAIWVRPGVGLVGQSQAIPANYEWSVETGIRRTFSSF